MLTGSTAQLGSLTNESGKPLTVGFVLAWWDDFFHSFVETMTRWAGFTEAPLRREMLDNPDKQRQTH
jgi:hypothetical protein